MIERAKDLQAGDVYIVNDPYLGGTHLMDVRFVKPFFYQGKLFAWLANTGHWPDTGGAVPGGFSANATEVEQFYPVLFEEYSLHEGSGGAGKQRGGFGVNYKIKLRRGNAKVSMVMDHGRFGPQGVLGGKDGGVNFVQVEQNGEPYIPAHLSKDQNILVQTGDTIRVSTPGGGGYENPFLRNPDLVRHDVQRGYYTPQEAQERFGVVLNPQNEVDSKATQKLRKGQSFFNLST